MRIYTVDCCESCLFEIGLFSSVKNFTLFHQSNLVENPRLLLSIVSTVGLFLPYVMADIF